MKKKLNAFTLAETMIVIVVLGIIATLTIPALVNKNKESVAKTKVRKAMAAYESALNKMIIENDLKSDTALNEWASATANCGNPSNYFKKVQDVNGCKFKTSDGIWWDISNIERPLIAFNQDNLTIDKANNANDKTAFVLVGRFGTDGSLRVDDLAYETSNPDQNSDKQVAKLYNLLSGKKSSDIEETPEYAGLSAEEYESIIARKNKYLNGAYSARCEDLYGENVVCKGPETSSSSQICKSCTTFYSSYDSDAVFDDDGNYIASCGTDGSWCEFDFRLDNDQTELFFECDSTECYESFMYSSSNRGDYRGCDGDFKNCTSSLIPDTYNNMQFNWKCDGKGSNCTGIGRLKITLDNGGTISAWEANCNLDASYCTFPYGISMSYGVSSFEDYFDYLTDEVTGKKYYSLKEQYRPTRNSNLTYSE